MVAAFVAALILTVPLAAQAETIPLFVGEHHADHMEFFFRYGTNTAAAMIVLDAHADTVANEHSALIQSLAAAGNLSRHGNINLADLAGNHNWIHPLVPTPLESLVWISTIRGPPRTDKLQGYLYSVTQWNSAIRPVYASVAELRFLDIAGETLLVSVDLDFFYSEDHGPDDVPAVLDALFTFTSQWPGPSVWAICLSRPWLPDDRYAWDLLGRCLYWLCSRPEFGRPEIDLFDSRRVDTSRTAQAWQAEGREAPVLRETDAPAYIRELIQELLNRN